MLHHVRDAPYQRFSPNEHLTVSPDFLDKTLNWIGKHNIDIITMDEVAIRLKDPHKSANQRRFVAITFDDAYRDNLQYALPVLEKHQAPFTIYVASGLVEGLADVWWENIEALIRQQDHLVLATAKGTIELNCDSPVNKQASYQQLLAYLTEELSEMQQREKVRELAWLYKIDLEAHRKREIMNWRELRQLSTHPLCTLGAHTIHHYALARLDQKDARLQMRESARVLEVETGEETRHFAYPYGYPAAAGPRDFQLAGELGFQTAVTTRPGVIYPEHGEHLTALPRISLNGKFQKNRYTKALVSGLPTLAMNRFERLNVD